MIPFHLGKEPIGQPKQTYPGTSSTEETPASNNPNVAGETISPDESKNEPGCATSSQIVTLDRLPSAIEIIECTPSQSSSEIDHSEKTSSSVVAKNVTTIFMSQSPDYSPCLINLLASDSSSSEETVQAYFNQKVISMEMEAPKRSLPDSQRLIPKESEIEAVTVTPAANTSSGE